MHTKQLLKEFRDYQRSIVRASHMGYLTKAEGVRLMLKKTQEVLLSLKVEELPTDNRVRGFDYMTPDDEQLADESVKGIPMNEGREYTYQADWSFQGQMYHVRCDDWEAFKKAKENMESILPKTDSFPNDSGNTATSPNKVIANVPMCEIHKIPMQERQGKYGMFWSCGQKNVDGTWCKFKPKL